MNNDTPNRMASTRKRSPTDEPEATAPVDQPPAPIDGSVEIPQPPLNGVRCVGCGVDVLPKRDSQRGPKSYGTCPRCGARMLLLLKDGKWIPGRLVG